MSHNIMIDLETLGTTADSVILSIGAVRFDLEAGTVFDDEGSTFYRSVAVEKQVGRTISADTLTWWTGQGKDAQAVFTEPKTSLVFALMDLQEWVDPTEGAYPYVWSNGADFDLPMLVHAFDQAELVCPWKPYAGRCYRTFKNLPGARAIKVERQGQHHNALDDAIYQARHLCAIHQSLFAPTSTAEDFEMTGVDPFTPVSLGEGASA